MPYILNSSHNSNIMSNEENHRHLTDLQHAIAKPGTYVGSDKKQTNTIYVFDPETRHFELRDVKYVPAWYKIVDEILVNAIDRYVLFPKKVKRIQITFEMADGTIEITNDGPGIPLKDFKLNDGTLVPLPQAIASAFKMGSNFDPNKKRITGGTNGFGLKLTNAYSDYLRLLTITKAGKKKTSYCQEFENRLSVIHEPTVETVDTKTEESTSIRFRPSYANMGYSQLTPEDKAILHSLVQTRAYQAAAFVGAEVFFNSSRISVGTNFTDFAAMFVTNEFGLYHTVLKNKADADLDWELCIGISDGKFRQVSLINGIYVYKGGSHIKHIQNEIVANIKPRAIKILGKQNKFNSNVILNNLFIVFKASFDKPTFNSQIKCELDDPIEHFADYKFKPSEWSKIWEFLADHVTANLIDKASSKKKVKVNRGRIALEKGDDATFAGHKTKFRKCSLIICEGDSAMATVDRGITHKKSELNYQYYGTFSIQGVPMNARKECRSICDKKNKVTRLIRNKKLQDNKRFRDLVTLLGLDFEKTYSAETKEGEQEFETLRYGRVIIAVDQDEDGKGQIFGLLLNFFMLFWPDLVKRGFVNRLNTPIIRAYLKSCKNKPQTNVEFYSLSAYEEWIRTKFGGDNDKMTKLYNIEYYKGLGTHDQKRGEILPMFVNINSKLIRYTLNGRADDDMEAYFGKKTDMRKIALATPVSTDDERKADGSANIPVSLVLRTDVKEFQRDNILRKLPHSIDGLVPSRRKVLFAAREIFGATPASNKKVKVCAFTGDVMKKTMYHHGDASLSETIIKMCQDFPGAKNLPLLIGIGEFGTKSKGGKDHASARYTFTKLNQKLTNALFPREDDFLLSYQFDDGYRCEPTFYIPIVPLGIMEHMEIPATGWKAKLWARDWRQVVKNVEWRINAEYPRCRRMDIWLKDNSSDLRMWNGKMYAVGKYIFDQKKNILTITELPPCVYDTAYLNKVLFRSETTDKGEKKKVLRDEFTSNYRIASSYDEERNKYETKIIIELQPGIMDKIMSRCVSNDDADSDDSDSDVDNGAGDRAVGDGDGGDFNVAENGYPFDPVEDFMKLKIPLTSNINMIAHDGTVKEYARYEHVFDEWFEVRKQLYKERVERMIVLTSLMIKYLKNIIRFSEHRDEYDITNKTPEKKFIQILKTNKYDMFNKTLLFNPRYTAVDELEHLIVNNPDAGTTYNYIIDLTYRQLLQEACQKRKEVLAKEEEKLKLLMEDSDESGNNFKGKKIWFSELQELKSVIKCGLRGGWSD